MAQSNRNDQVLKAESALHDQYNLLPRSQLVSCLGILSFCMLISFIDQNGISITQPTIAKDLNASATISWAGTSSLIANTTFQMLYGRLSDIFGRKAVFLGAVGLLAIADLLCGLSRNPAMFYVFRGVSGIGSGGIANIAMIIVSDVVTLEERGKYQGIFGTMESYSCSFRYLEVIADPSMPPCLALIDARLATGGAYFEWNSPMVISMLAIGSFSCLLFLVIEWKIAKLPMMPVTIFANKEVVILLIHSFLFGAVYQSCIYYLPLYLLNARQFEVLEAAAISTALFTFQAVFSTLSSLYISHFNRYGEVIWFGFATWTLGAGLCLNFDRHTSPGAIIGPLMVIGTGVGCIFQPTLVALQAHSPKSRRAVIISNRNFFRCCGGAVGLAISAAILQAALRSMLPAEYAYLADSTYALPTDLESGPSAERVYDAYMHASHSVFLMQVPMIGVSLIGCLFIKDQGLEAKEEASSGEEEPQGTMLGLQDNTLKV
ncbi:hypothetical protein CEP52_006597 [Fusarium oligoseptatum]|uniref:Major facilitator superfamily (MFS) profile domain-containing protein n=1 Tax=Fusarium oligoseptatum TaxID=2604345 RepID=A0A428TSN2_9HYPO|nr:hypothetical protein CEP52_006597 [Fusarium oligoseptatum]